MSYRDSTAYDFDLFAPKKVVEIPDSPTAKKRKQSASRKKKGTQTGRKVLSGRLTTVAAVAAVVVLIIAQLHCQLQNSEVVDQIYQTEKQIEVLQSENTRLQVELEGKVSFTNMEAIAKSKGMQKATVAQTKYVNLHTEDASEVVGEDEGLLAVLAEWF